MKTADYVKEACKGRGDFGSLMCYGHGIARETNLGYPIMGKTFVRINFPEDIWFMERQKA
jgi:hypothetical protein